MDVSDVLATVLAFTIAIVLFFVSVIAIIICGIIVQLWVVNVFGMDIDKTLYWTGVALIILFATFCKTSKDKE